MISLAKLRCVAVVMALARSAVLCSAIPAADAPEAERTVIVANSADSYSKTLAEYYAAARGIPLSNIVALPMATTEAVKWPEFLATVFNPLSAELLARGWIEGIDSPLKDEIGRRKATFAGHRISYLVLMRGVPLRIDENPDWHATPMPADPNSGFERNQASVDGELALLAVNGTRILSYVNNPLFRQREVTKARANSVVRVARLDGLTPSSVRGMIDSGLAAERQGLAGRAYVDVGGLPHPLGNTWLESVAGQFESLGFETEVDRAAETFRPLARFDAPVLYFGWYAWDVDGPFTVPGFRFPPGAIAVHIHSFSAVTLHNASKNWCGPLVMRGAAATLGNVFEPFLALTHHLDLFTESLLRGETLGTAAYYSLPALSWQAVLVGDPLYRPFACSAEAQWAARAKLPVDLQPYAALRQARLALRAGQKEEAARLARAAFREAPAVPIGVSVAQLLREAEGRVSAVKALQFLSMLRRYELRELGAVRAAAALLVECGEFAMALSLYDKALAEPPALGEVELLEEAIRVASQAGKPARAQGWQSRLAVVKPPPPPPPAPATDGAKPKAKLKPK